jgi:amidophosphoribosyltransferase
MSSKYKMSRIELNQAYLLGRPREKCGIFGVHGDSNAAGMVRRGLELLQKRGQDSAGISGYLGSESQRIVGLGLVKDVFPNGDLRGLNADRVIGHVRYSTAGGVSLSNAQPIRVEIGPDRYLDVAHNGNFADPSPLLGLRDLLNLPHHRSSDTGIFTDILGHFLRRGATLKEAFMEVEPYIPGVYTLLMQTPEEMGVARCEYGIKPGFRGRKGDAIIISSETNALDDAEATDIEELVPGELLIINRDGEVTPHKFAEPKYKLCIFEPVYFADPKSRFYGRTVEDYRIEFGRELAREFPVDADMIMPLLNSGKYAAQGYHEVSGIPIMPGVRINEDIDRTFITADMDERRAKARAKYIVDPEIVRGKRIITIDDSQVNGVTDEVVVEMLLEAGALAVYVGKASPIYRYPNNYGTNTSEQHRLVSFRRSEDQIRRHIKADKLGFLSLAGMKRTLGRDADKFDFSVYTGEYPVSIGDKIHDIEYALAAV